MTHDLPAGLSPVCPSCGRNLLRPPHRTNHGGPRVCCRGWLAQIQAAEGHEEAQPTRSSPLQPGSADFHGGG